MKTQAEVIELMSQWESDPCWDIEDTAGFEDHFIELKAFRFKREQEWAAERMDRLRSKAKWLGIPGNTTLAAHIERLETQIQELRNALFDVRNPPESR